MRYFFAAAIFAVNAALISAGCFEPSVDYAVISPPPGYYQLDRSVGDKITITCNDGHYLYHDVDDGGYISDNRFSCRCSRSGRWSPSPEEYVCLSSPPKGCKLEKTQGLITKPDQTQIKVGVTVTFACEDEYSLVGVTKTQCESSGQFRDSIPSCKKHCKKPMASALIVDPSKDYYAPGEQIKLACEDGYRLRGISTRYCESSGEFNRAVREGICEMRGCKKPADIKHGSFSPQKDMYEVGSKITYECEKNYYANEKLYRICTSKNIFVWKEPKCIEAVCSKPMDIENGGYTSDDKKKTQYSIGESVKYFCDENYAMSTGTGVRECKLNSDGKSGSFQTAPSCQLIQCDHPEKLSNGKYEPVAKKYDVDEYVKYTCDDGYKLVGEATATCKRVRGQMNGEFSPAPVCEPIECGRPMDIENGELKDRPKSSYRLRETVAYECDPGYTFGDSPGTATCKLNRDGISASFTDAPECVPVVCSKPMDIENGKLQDRLKPSYKLRETVAYKCDPGFTFGDSPGTSTCRLNRDGMTASFTEAPECVPIVCSKPMTIRDGKLTSKPRNSYGIGQTVSYVCDRGFKLSFTPGESTCTLDRDGASASFSDPPECLALTCRSPRTVENGRLTTKPKDSYNIDEYVTYECKSGYKLSFSPGRSTCKLNKDLVTASFSEAPECLPVVCTKPMPIGNGRLASKPKAQYRVEEFVTYVCDRGYKLSSVPGRSTCKLGRDGLTASFTSPPECEKIYCNNPGKPSGGEISPDKPKYEYEEEVEFSCKECYAVKGKKKAVCTETGKFDSPVPVCEVIICAGYPRQPIYGEISPREKNMKCGTEVKYTCTRGFNLMGPSSTTCMSNGEYSVTEPPTCRPVMCKLPPKIPRNLEIKPRSRYSYPYGKKISFSCEGGYSLAGDVTSAVCQENGQFSHPLPSCSSNQCGQPPKIAKHGSVKTNGKTKFDVGDKVYYDCDMHYELDGVYSNRCGHDGKWVYSAPTCKPPSCENSCFGGAIPGRPCQCDSGCSKRKDCCADYSKHCEMNSCRNRCGEKGETCSCDTMCYFSDPGCCADYNHECPGMWY